MVPQRQPSARTYVYIGGEELKPKGVNIPPGRGMTIFLCWGRVAARLTWLTVMYINNVWICRGNFAYRIGKVHGLNKNMYQ